MLSKLQYLGILFRIICDHHEQLRPHGILLGGLLVFLDIIELTLNLFQTALAIGKSGKDRYLQQ